MARKILALALLGAVALLSNACSGVPGGSGSSGSGGSGSGGSGSGGSGTPQFIGGSVVGLAGSGMVLEDNGADDLTITGTGTVAFTFKTGAVAYNVTVKTQPSSPAQTCSVVNGVGKATAAVTNVQVNCVQVFTITGTVSGLDGSGLVLLDNGGDPITISGTGNVPFTFPTPIAVSSPYAVTIKTQPTNPAQTCTITNGSGTAQNGLIPVQIDCPQPTFTIGGTLIGLVNGPGDTVELLNNGGDNLFVTSNNTTWQFPTAVTANGAYDVSIFVQPTSQPQPCVEFFYKGVATTNITSVLIDCQHNDWTWMTGPDTAGSFGAAVLPQPSPNTNSASARDFAAAWTDSNGNKWLFGGFGNELVGKNPPDLPGFLSDLWYFDPNNEGGWAPAGVQVNTVDHTGNYVGSPNICAQCTSTAVVSPFENTDTIGTNTAPGARWGSVTWSDASGNLFLFGGQGYGIPPPPPLPVFGLLNDIWEFTPNFYDDGHTQTAPLYTPSGAYLGTWHPISHNSTVNGGGTYGTLGNPGGYPGGRWGAGFAPDASGNVWMFGGQGYDSAGNLGLLNDLWKYNIASQQWTWLGPTNSNVGQNNGIYGTLGTALAVNAPGPGGRQTPAMWADNTGNIWIFGGLGLDSVGTLNSGANNGNLPAGVSPNGALLNDLWKYNIATQQWTWVSGGGATGLANQTGVYGTQLTAATTNIPGSRWSPAAWTDFNGNIWLFGGWGYASAIAQSTGFLNDVWEFHPSNGEWTWWKGSSNVNANGYYPTQFSPDRNVPFTLNTPGGRRGMAVWQQDSLDYIYIFGGQGYDSTSSTGNGYLNDFWSYLGYPD
jgi:Galactose oxidase, central domain